VNKLSCFSTGSGSVLRIASEFLLRCYYVTGYFGAGWFRDLWRIPEYVRDANSDPVYERELKQKIKETETPPWKTARWMGMLCKYHIQVGTKKPA
jgi:hypothetical protein